MRTLLEEGVSEDLAVFSPVQGLDDIKMERSDAVPVMRDVCLWMDSDLGAKS